MHQDSLKKYHLAEQKIPHGFQIFLGENGVEVAGIQHRRDTAARFVSQKDQWLEFEAEPYNQFDKYAIKVLGCYNENEKVIKLHVGYVPANLSKQITLFSIQKCIPRLFKTYIGKSGYVEIQFQVLATKSNACEKDNDSKTSDTLSDKAQTLMVEKTNSWEYLLFFQVWSDEVNLLQERIQQYQNIASHDQVQFNSENFISWGESQLNEIKGHINNANKLINVEANKAFGPPGKAGNDKDIIRVAKDMAKLLVKILDWSIYIRSYKAEEPFSRVLKAMSRFPESVITNLREFPASALDKIEKALSVASPGNRPHVDLTIDFKISNYDEYESAFEDVYKHNGF
ncbi:MAG: hypothetical protein PHZ02_06945 [Desulfocapsaceae bacterium]|nr:hypothetical protein [Desulfocapsaceae bacterium]